MFGYFAMKRAAERVVAESGVPWTTLRATRSKIWTAVMRGWPGWGSRADGVPGQPVDSGEVADRLVELALGEPAGPVPDIAGPRVYEFAELLRGYLKTRHKHRLIVPIRLPGKAARAFRTGANLAPDGVVGRRTWEEFLADRVGSSGDRVSGLA